MSGDPRQDYEQRLALYAPEMLSLLRTLVRWQDSGKMEIDFSNGWMGQPEETILIARSLINKVEGEPTDGNGRAERAAKKAEPE